MTTLRETLRERGLEKMVEKICRRYRVTFEELFSEGRGERHISAARQELWGRLRSEGHSWPAIAKICGVNDRGHVRRGAMKFLAKQEAKDAVEDHRGGARQEDAEREPDGDAEALH